MSHKYLLIFFICTVFFYYAPNRLLAQTSSHATSEQVPRELTLTQAVMCEEIQNNSPENISVIFSTDLEKVCCYTLFDPVLEKGNIYHAWYYRDNFITRIKLTIKPTRWSTFSRLQLRKMDKGPWRVEIHDESGKIFHVLRFSITD